MRHSWDTKNLLLVCLVWLSQLGITGRFHRQRMRVEIQHYVTWPLNHKHNLLALHYRMNHLLCYPPMNINTKPTHAHTWEREEGRESERDIHSNYTFQFVYFFYITKVSRPIPLCFYGKRWSQYQSLWNPGLTGSTGQDKRLTTKSQPRRCDKNVSVHFSINSVNP